jgi:hypothetical protein
MLVSAAKPDLLKQVQAEFKLLLSYDHSLIRAGKKAKTKTMPGACTMFARAKTWPERLP